MSSEQERMDRRSMQEFALPLYTEIPDVGLYLKQVVKYLNETLQPWFNLSVTETMISNYVKMHLVPNAVKKQYYRDQIASFLFIVLAKQVVSLDNIQILLKMQKERFETKEAYELFSGAFMKVFRKTFTVNTEPVEERKTASVSVEEERMTELDLTGAEEQREETLDSYQSLILNIIIAIVQKYYIERCFQELMEAEEDEAESSGENKN